MTDLIEEIQKRNLNVVWDQDGFAFRKGEGIVCVSWTSVVRVDMHSQLKDILVGYAPFITNTIVIEFQDKNGNKGVFEDDLSVLPALTTWNRHTAHGLLKMAIERAPKGTISGDIVQFIHSHTTPKIELLKKKAWGNLFFIIAGTVLFGVVAWLIIQFRK